MLRLVANENIPFDLVHRLRSDGHDLTWIRTDCPGSSDPEVLALAEREQRCVLTFDKGFGELAFRRKLPARCGIILLRFLLPTSQAQADAVSAALRTRTDWSGHFSVIEKDRIRMTPIVPKGGEGPRL